MDDEEDIVWFEDGHEIPFEVAGARRPWLEESSDWGSDGGADGEQDDDADEPPALIWV